MKKFILLAISLFIMINNALADEITGLKNGMIAQPADFTVKNAYTIESFESSDSSFISGAQYDPKTRELSIDIHNNSGKTQYKYYDVDRKTFDKFKSSESKGVYFNQNIRNHYDYQRTKQHKEISPHL